MQIKIVIIKATAIGGNDYLVVGQRDRKRHADEGANVDIFAALKVDVNWCSAVGAIEH